MFCADFRKPSERSSREIQWDVSLFFDIHLSLGALCFPFFKLTLSLIAVKIVQNCWDKGASQRINLMLWYPSVVFLSRHSPLLYNLLDSFSPCIRLFNFTFRRGRCRLTGTTGRNSLRVTYLRERRIRRDRQRAYRLPSRTPAPCLWHAARLSATARIGRCGRGWQ